MRNGGQWQRIHINRLLSVLKQYSQTSLICTHLLWMKATYVYKANGIQTFSPHGMGVRETTVVLVSAPCILTITRWLAGSAMPIFYLDNTPLSIKHNVCMYVHMHQTYRFPKEHHRVIGTLICPYEWSSSALHVIHSKHYQYLLICAQFTVILHRSLRENSTF